MGQFVCQFAPGITYYHLVWKGNNGNIFICMYLLYLHLHNFSNQKYIIIIIRSNRIFNSLPAPSGDGTPAARVHVPNPFDYYEWNTIQYSMLLISFTVPKLFQGFHCSESKVLKAGNPNIETLNLLKKVRRY